jgi:hypothetical protein
MARDYAWFLRRVADLHRLPYLEQGVTSRQFSSYNRGSRYDRETGLCEGMDLNGDAGHVMAVHAGPDVAAELAAFGGIPDDTPRFRFGDLEWVLDPLERNHVFFLPAEGVEQPVTRPPGNIVAAIPGPGCIFRIWSADPRGHIRFYFDGRTEPLEFEFAALFDKGLAEPGPEDLARRREWPFLSPMVFRRGGEGARQASNCYLPIPFAESCVVTLTDPSFYHIGYKTYPEDTPVQTFRLPLTPEEDTVLDEVSQRLLDRGAFPEPAYEFEPEGHEQFEHTWRLEPGEARTVRLSGPGVVEAFHARFMGGAGERYVGSKVLLTGEFDGESCIWSPLVSFFGTGFEPRDYRSYPLGYIDGEGYCYLPMPYRNQALLTLHNQARNPVTVELRLRTARYEELPANTMYLKCKYRREQVSETFDYPFLECEGAPGRFVGTAITVDDAWRSWWGEGDEKIWVDDDVFPSFFGTGSEDFFGDAWGIRRLTESFYACSLSQSDAAAARISCYRWMVPDDVPFHERVVGTIENYPETLWGTASVEWDEDYVSTAYWYQMAGGRDSFAPVPVEDRRPWGKTPQPFVVEAEAVFADVPGAELVLDDGLPYEFSKGMCVDLGQVEAGDRLVFMGPRFVKAGPYAIHLHTEPGGADPAPFELRGDDLVLGRLAAGTAGAAELGLGAAVLPRDPTAITLVFTGPGRAVFDCFQFVPARQIQDAIEAETLTATEVAGPEPVRETGVLWSGGQQLCFPAEAPGESFAVAFEVPAGNWNPVAGLTKGPGYGLYQVYVNGTPGPVVDCYAPSLRVLDRVKLGKLKGENGRTVVRFECIGRNPAATGAWLGLDYLSRHPITVEDSIEGETAEVVGVRDGTATTQFLGYPFSGDSQLWFHGNDPGAEFTWLLPVERSGEYRLTLYFTKSWDYAVVQVAANGEVLGEIDTYAPDVEWDGPTTFEGVSLQEGLNRLTFTVTGKHEKSKGHLVGVDCLTLEQE